MIECIVCGSEFEPRKKGVIRCYGNACKKERVRRRSNAWYKNNKNRAFDLHKNWLAENPAHELWKSAKRRCELSNLSFDLDWREIHIPELCPVLGVPMIKGTRHAPSIDRKDNSKGYTKDNIEIMSRKANTMKNDATDEELERFADWVKNR